MNYYNAKDLLPAGLTCELQKYLQGAYLYIPVKKEARKGWGDAPGDVRNLTGETKKFAAPINAAFVSNIWQRNIASLSQR